MLLNYITWNVNPEIFHIGSLSIRWYGLLFAMSFLFGYIIMQKFFKKENLSIELLDKLTLYMFLGTIIGARLGHCFFYEPAYYLSNPLEIIKIWHGGLASHGAAIGILLALYLFSRKVKKPFLWTMDRVVIVVALAGSLIRMGNLMNSEIIGNPTTVSWAFIFERVDNIPRHPAQIYESLSYLILFVVLYRLFVKTDIAKKQGLIFSIFLVVLFIARFIIEFFKAPQVNFEKYMTYDMGQWLSLPFIVVGVVMFFVLHNKYKVKNSN
ncbi:MAG: prolipoprotein diacylglyceryl transferase [Bacteroidetes bacterium]|nr:MAG: prolipoprotein diacylglyceryl transferase [Bacteroidota bacterium]